MTTRSGKIFNVELNNFTINNKKIKKNYDICTICLQELKNKLIKTNCNHSFHKKCILKWYSATLIKGLIFNCPICRKVIYPKTISRLLPLKL